MTDNTAKVLARLMQERNISQAELFRSTGVTQPTISRILNPDSENGIKSPSDAQVRPLAGFLRISTDQLRGYQPMNGKALPDDGESSMATTNTPTVSTFLINKIAAINDPEVLESLVSIVCRFSDGHFSEADAKMVADLADRLAKPLRGTTIRRVQRA